MSAPRGHPTPFQSNIKAMKILVVGASGMVGQGVLRECLEAPDVAMVTTLGRAELSQQHPKLMQLSVPDLNNLKSIEGALQGFDACFYCLGVSSSGMSEQAYTAVTYNITLTVARALAARSPSVTFVYVSGAGTDNSEKGSSMWARVKGRTENDLQRLGLAHVVLFRPGVIQPLDGIVSKTPSYRLVYRIVGPILSVLRVLMPGRMITTRSIGKAMLGAVRQRVDGVFEAAGIARLALVNPRR